MRSTLDALYIVAGLVTFDNPTLAAVLLTLALGASLVAAGIMRLILAFSIKRATPRSWLAISGVITLLIGSLILARWPINSVYILGLFLGADLIVAGASWIGVSFGLRRSPIVKSRSSRNCRAPLVSREKDMHENNSLERAASPAETAFAALTNFSLGNNLILGYAAHGFYVSSQPVTSAVVQFTDNAVASGLAHAYLY